MKSSECDGTMRPASRAAESVYSGVREQEVIHKAMSPMNKKQCLDMAL